MSDLIDRVVPYITWKKIEKRWCDFYETPDEFQSLYEPRQEICEYTKECLERGEYDYDLNLKEYHTREVAFMEAHNFYREGYTLEDLAELEETDGRYPWWCVYDEKYDSWDVIFEDDVAGIIAHHILENDGEIRYAKTGVTIKEGNGGCTYQKNSAENPMETYELLILAYIKLCESDEEIDPLTK